MAKEAPFDPCRQWLGIDAVDLGNARLVLGVAAQESDPQVVIRAADARLNLLRAIAPGPFELARTSLVTRVEEARETLLAEIAAGSTRSARPTVDGFAMPAPPAQLAGAVPVPAPQIASVPLPGSASPPPVPGQGGWGGRDSGGDGDGLGTIRIRTTVYRKKTPVAGIALTMLALAAAAGGLAYYRFVVKGQRQMAGQARGMKSVPERKGGATLAQLEHEREASEREDRERQERERKQQQEREREEEREREREREQREQEQTARQERERQEREREKQKGETPENASSREEMPEQEPKQSQQLDDTLAQIFAAMRPKDGEPDHGRIAELLQAAAGQANGPDAKKRVAGWRKLAAFHKGFLEYRRQALAAVKGGDEYDFKDRKIAIVEVDDEQLKYQDNGRPKTVSWEAMPAGLALAIVTQWFDARPENDLYIGAYHFAKREPSPQLAREHWEKAEAGGADASALMPLLDDPVFIRAVAEE